MILAIDTATRWTGLALHDGTAVCAEYGWRANNTQTMELAPTVQHLLKQIGVAPDQLSAIAVALGPGSYTGLRIGLGFAKGWSLAHNTPIVGIPTMDIMAASLGHAAGTLVVITEAGRTRVNAGTYQWEKGKGWQMQGQPTIETWDELIARLAYPTILVGEISGEARAQVKQSGKRLLVAPPADNARRAGYLAELGWQKVRNGRLDDPRTLTPLYLKEPDGS